MLSLNSFIFPRPNPSYDKDLFPDYFCEIIHISRKQNKSGFWNDFMQACCNQISRIRKLECADPLFVHEKTQSQRLLNILSWKCGRSVMNYCQKYCQEIYHNFNLSIIAVEYPGYGIYNSNEGVSQEEIELDAEAVYKHMVENMKIQQSKIILFGRSMGSGPACYLSSKFQPKGLILMSGFSSIRAVAIEHVKILGYLLKERFDNLSRASQIYCPCLLIHGRSDTLIPFQQSEQVFNNLKSMKKIKKFPFQMTHNDFDFHTNLKLNIAEFFELIEESDLIIESN